MGAVRPAAVFPPPAGRPGILAALPKSPIEEVEQIRSAFERVQGVIMGGDGIKGGSVSDASQAGGALGAVVGTVRVLGTDVASDGASKVKAVGGAATTGECGPAPVSTFFDVLRGLLSRLFIMWLRCYVFLTLCATTEASTAT